MRAFICPQCGAQLSLHDMEREFAFCEYCGQRIDLADHRTVHTEHYVDEAKLKEAEAHIREIELKEAKFEQALREKRAVAKKEKLKQERLLEKARKRRNIFIGFCVVCAPMMFSDAGGEGLLILIIAGIVLFRTLPARDARMELIAEGGCELPHSIRHLENKTHTEIAAALRRAGFTDIKTVNLHDIKIGWLTKPGKIESIQIEGQDIVAEEQVIKDAYQMIYEPNVSIVITYHGK